jgi:hypothetical protein
LLAVSGAFALAASDIQYLELLKMFAAIGAGIAAPLSVAAFLWGRSAVDSVRATENQIEVRRTSMRGSVASFTLPYSELAAFAVDANLRSLGADNLLVAVTKTGERITIIEGEPHTTQIRDFALELSRLSSLPIEHAHPVMK